MAKKEFLTSNRLMEAIRKLGFEQKYKVCEAFYQMFIEGFPGDDSGDCQEFRFLFEETLNEISYQEVRQLKRCVNEMELALDEIDHYDPMTFFDIADRLTPLIVTQKLQK